MGAVLVGEPELEEPALKIAVMHTADLTPFLFAQAKGYFREAGFSFDRRDWIEAASGRESVDLLKAGTVDMAYATYPPFLGATGGGRPDVKLIAAASAAGPDSCAVVASPNSKVKTIKDLVGVRLAVTARGTIADFLTRSTLKANGVDPAAVQWVELPFNQMIPKLFNHEIDAAFMTDPYLSEARTLGATQLFDVATGPRANMPTAGFGTTAKFANMNPRTVAAFQQVMQRAANEVSKDWHKVVPLLQEFASTDKISTQSASRLTLNANLDEKHVQRVIDLMADTGVMTKAVNLQQLIIHSILFNGIGNGLQEGYFASHIGAFFARILRRAWSRRRRRNEASIAARRNGVMVALRPATYFFAVRSRYDLSVA